MQKIIPHLWFNNEGKEAITLYTKMLADSHLNHTTNLQDTPSGDVSLFDFKLANLTFQAINGGPYFKFNESISLFVSLDTAEKVDTLYETLIEGGRFLMPLDTYDFSPRYGWIADRYGLNWQLMYSEDAPPTPFIKLCLLFSSGYCGLAENAMDTYTSIFKNAHKGHVSYYKDGEATNPAAKINYGELHLDGLDLVLMDHGFGGEADFNEAISFMVLCDDQAEIDYYWNCLSHVPEAEQCGWVKDQFGVSWQIVPRNMGKYLSGSPESAKRVTEAFLKMKKFDLAALEAAYQGL